MKVKATLTITVWIDDVENEQDVHTQLRWAAEHLASEGLLSGDGPAPATVDTWESKVKVERASD